MSKVLENFKFEADLTVFGTAVTLKPMEGDEIGYRAPLDDKGINVSQKKLTDSKLLPADSPILPYIPQNTYISALIYNRKLKKIEFAVDAEFANAKEMTDDEVNALDSDGVKAKMNERKLSLKKDDQTDKSEADMKAELKAYEPFILNKYPDIFTLDRLAVYLELNTGTAE